MTHDASHSYTYDAENRITQVDGGSTATYQYDPNGRRVSRVVAGVETDYIYDLSGHVVQSYGGGCGSTCLNTAFMYLNGQLLAEYGNGTTYFAIADHLGSTRLLTGYPTASVVECDDYYPFGESTNCGGTSTTTHKFTGYERDSETALDNAQARYNSSAMGRFMSPDPDNASGFENQDDPQSWNAYSYVRNNPLTLTDPDGRDYAACLYTDNGQSCVTYSNESDLQNALQGTGATLSGTEENGQIVINVNGQNQVVGTYQNFIGPGTEGGGLSDDPIIFPAFEGGVIGGLVSAARGFLEGLLGSTAREGLEGVATGVASGTATSSGTATVDDILDGAARHGVSRSRQFLKSGGIQQAESDFESLAGREEVRGSVRIKELPNGQGRAVLRSDPSSWGGHSGPTIEVQPPGGGYANIKIRY